MDELPTSARQQLRKALVYLYLLVRHKQETDEQGDLFAVLDEAVEQHVRDREEAKMTGAEVLIRQGKEEGKEDGRREGEEEGREEGALFQARTMLLEIGRRRLGEPDADTVSRISALTDKSIIQDLCLVVPDTETWQDLFSKLDDRDSGR